MFGYTAVADSTPAAFDRILDFQSGVDKIDLRSVHTGIADKYGIAVQGSDTLVFVDQGGDGTSELLIVLVGVANLQASDVFF